MVTGVMANLEKASFFFYNIIEKEGKEVSIMALIKWEPFRDIERFFEEDFPSWTKAKMGWDLAADVYEENGKIMVRMNLPGIDPDKLDISVENSYVRICGSREEEKEEKGKNYFSREIRRGDFERTVRLPGLVKLEGVEAEYSNGVLMISLPKAEIQGHKIKVKMK